MTAFEPIEGAPYGKCSTCSLTIATEDESRTHMSETMSGGRSHSIRITNPPRAQRIRSRVAMIVEDAINESMYDFDRYVDRGEITEDELADALRSFPDFADARQEYVEASS